MPLKLDLDTITDSIDLDECYELLIESKFHPSDQEGFLSVAPILKKLNNNDNFLTDLLISELDECCKSQEKPNKYTPQVIMLKEAKKSVNFFMRANIWLAKDDPLLLTSGEKSFFYHVPHDHNFNFLTSGYFGPGYSSEYYEYNYYDVDGYPGEPVNLKYIETNQLKKGEVMLYRAYKDVHNQLPADDLSVSLNIMPSTMFAHLKPQYIFNQECTHIEKSTVTSNSSVEPVFHLISEMKNDRSRKFLERIARSCVIEEDRFRAIKALVSAESTNDGKSYVIESLGLTSNSKLVKELSRLHQLALGIA